MARPDDLKLYAIMSTSDGRAVISDWLDQMGYFGETYATNPYDHAKLAGMRTAALVIVNSIERNDSHQWLQLLKERYEPVKPKPREDEDG